LIFPLYYKPKSKIFQVFRINIKNIERVIPMIGQVIIPIASIYETKDANSLITDEIFYGHTVTIIEVYDHHYYIKTDYHYFGFMDKSAIQVIKKLPDEERSIIKPYCDVLSEPSYQSKIMMSLPMGAKISIKSQIDDKWAKVQLHQHKVGYLPLQAFHSVQTEVDLRECIVKHAFTFLNTNYKWGGKSILGLDCSGLVHLCYLLEGISLYRDTSITDDILKQFQMKRISKEKLQPADLIYMPGHVMMYIGHDQYIHSSETQTKVTINSLNPRDERYLSYLDESSFQYISCFNK
jgi:gamma-D-glutamyl-L-lysine dipeptidyl-peptidase